MAYISQGCVATHVRCSGTFNDKVVCKSKTVVAPVVTSHSTVVHFYTSVQFLSMMHVRDSLLFFGEMSY